MLPFWHTLPKPFFVLAPLAGVTDPAFRRLIANYGKPHAMWTEFISADGLCAAGRGRLLRGLAYTESQRPIVAQFFGARPETMQRAGSAGGRAGLRRRGHQHGVPGSQRGKNGGAGAALCRQPGLAQAMIRAARRGAGGLPVSAKIRLGYDRDELDVWLPALLDAEAGCRYHPRPHPPGKCRALPARWDAIAKAVDIRDRRGAPAPA